jgi:hypothetical protein
MPDDQIVAVALLTAENLRTFGSCLKKVYPIDQAPAFEDLIRALDEADQQDRRDTLHNK